MEQYIGEIRMFGGDYAPEGWAFCDGQLLSITQNEALFSLIQTTYGGDGQTTFALPDLRGRVPLHQGTHAGTPYLLGSKGGAETETLSVDQLPSHTHGVQASSESGNTDQPSDAFWARSTTDQYATTDLNTQMSSDAIADSGEGRGHENMMPYLSMSFIISLVGVYPSRN